MLEHEEIWRAIDRLADQNGLTASGLARRAGLDATTFNPSKRKTPSGRERWPSTESIAKILGATGFSFAEFVALLGQKGGTLAMQRVPTVALTRADKNSLFDEAGRPVGNDWDEAHFPDVADPHAYGLRVTDDSLVPVCRQGGLLIVAPTTELRQGDRAVAKTTKRGIMTGEVSRKAANRLELLSFGAERADVILVASEIEWTARVLWAQQ